MIFVFRDKQLNLNIMWLLGFYNKTSNFVLFLKICNASFTKFLKQKLNNLLL